MERRIRSLLVILLVISNFSGHLKIADMSSRISDAEDNVKKLQEVVLEKDTTSSEEIVEEDTYVHDEEVNSKKHSVGYSDIELLAKTLYGECGGVESDMEKAAVAWCILNRVDAGYGTIEEVITAPYQFVGYSPNHPVTDHLEFLAKDVLRRWHLEKEGEEDIGRVLPKEYLYFRGDGERNYFRKEYTSTTYWDWSSEDVYSSKENSYSY